MTTVTAYAEPETGSITLDILKTADVTSVTRINGMGAAAVRLAEGQLPSSATTGVVRTNLVTNPSFETGTTGYTNSASAYSTLSNPVSGGLFGSRYMRSTTNAAKAAQYGFGATFNITLTGGKTYVISYYGRGSEGVEFIAPWIQIGSNYDYGALLTAPAANGWTQYGVKFTAPGSGPQPATITINGYYSIAAGSDTPIGSTADFDGLMVEEATKLAPYFDGSTAATTGFAYQWTGTAHASTSTLVTTGGRLIITDYEASHGPNTYNVYAADGTFETTTVNLVLDKPWLMVPIAPTYSETAERVMNYTAGRESFSTVHRIIGRPDPLVALGRLGTRQGTLEFWTESISDAERLVRVFDRGEAVLLKQTEPGLDMYFTVSDLDVAPYSVEGQDTTRYRLSVSYTEVVRPFGNLAGALGWTFDALATDYASFNAVTAAFKTFDDLTLGDTK